MGLDAGLTLQGCMDATTVLKSVKQRGAMLHNTVDTEKGVL